MTAKKSNDINLSCLCAIARLENKFLAVKRSLNIKFFSPIVTAQSWNIISTA